MIHLSIAMVFIFLTTPTIALPGKDDKTLPQSKINRKKIQAIRCKDCRQNYKEGPRKCKLCKGNLEWLCSCGVWRSYANLSSHICSKTSRRKKLKEKFRREKKVIKKRVNKAGEKLVPSQPGISPLVEKFINHIIYGSLTSSAIQSLKTIALSQEEKESILALLPIDTISKNFQNQILNIIFPYRYKMRIDFICSRK